MLQDTMLKYYAKSGTGAEAAAGYINLSSETTVTRTSLRAFTLVTPRRVYNLACEEERDCEAWVDIITKAIASTEAAALERSRRATLHVGTIRRPRRATSAGGQAGAGGGASGPLSGNADSSDSDTSDDEHDKHGHRRSNARNESRRATARHSMPAVPAHIPDLFTAATAAGALPLRTTSTKQRNSRRHSTDFRSQRRSSGEVTQQGAALHAAATGSTRRSSGSVEAVGMAAGPRARAALPLPESP